MKVLSADISDADIGAATADDTFMREMIEKLRPTIIIYKSTNPIRIPFKTRHNFFSKLENMFMKTDRILPRLINQLYCPANEPFLYSAILISSKMNGVKSEDTSSDATTKTDHKSSWQIRLENRIEKVRCNANILAQSQQAGKYYKNLLDRLK